MTYQLSACAQVARKYMEERPMVPSLLAPTYARDADAYIVAECAMSGAEVCNVDVR